MPEGPEIRRSADQIAAAVAGRKVKEMFFAFDYLKKFEERFTGQTVSTVEARGKAILIRFPEGWNIYSHNQLYGKWLIRPAYHYPDTNRQLRLAIHNHQNSALLYSASDIEVLRDEELGEHPFLSKLGPDVLDPAVTAEQLVERFKDRRFARRQLAALFLDQGFLAGLGNYLRSEILFTAGVAPDKRPQDCSPEALQRLAQAALTLSRRSYQSNGITTDPQRAEKLKEKGWKRRDYRFQVFNRDGQRCFECGTPIEKTHYGSRRLYYCPRCQAE